MADPKMSEMVERLAKVLAETAPWADGQLLPIDAEQFIPAARAAILALKPATEAMVDAGWSGFMDVEGEAPARMWEAMIDEALKE